VRAWRRIRPRRRFVARRLPCANPPDQSNQTDDTADGQENQCELARVHDPRAGPERGPGQCGEDADGDEQGERSVKLAGEALVAQEPTPDAQSEQSQAGDDERGLLHLAGDPSEVLERGPQARCGRQLSGEIGPPVREPLANVQHAHARRLHRMLAQDRQAFGILPLDDFRRADLTGGQLRLVALPGELAMFENRRASRRLPGLRPRLHPRSHVVAQVLRTDRRRREAALGQLIAHAERADERNLHRQEGDERAAPHRYASAAGEEKPDHR